MKTKFKKQSTSKTSWGYQNLQIETCVQGNTIEGKAKWEKKWSLILKKIEF
jgi:hypothetical protein